MTRPLFPDEPLPARTIGLQEFVQLAEQYSNDDEIDRFVNFVLAGRAPNTNPNSVYNQRRIFVNPSYDDDFPLRYTILGDFDSVIGLSHTLPFAHPGPGINWHLVPLFSETLTTSIHIKWPINVTVQVPLHKIPNYMCFKFGTRHQGRLFFPNLYAPHRSPILDQEVLGNIYNVGVLPALRHVAEELAVQWPVTYKHISDVARGRDGRYTAVTKGITSNFLRNFASQLLERLADFDPGFEDAFFEIEAKGVKATSAHNPQDPRARAEAFASVLYPIDLTLIPDEELPSKWFIDVALEVHAKGRVMQWLTASHPHLIQHMLPSITLDQAAALKASAACKEDLSGHLTSLSGFRLEPGRRGRADHVSYLNVYTTDKSATYQQHEGIYRRRTGQDLLPKPFQKFILDVDTVADTFASCAGFSGDLQNDAVVQNGAARMEARVALQHAQAALMDIPDELVTDSILAIDSAYWWYFKFFRTSALYRLFKELATYPPEARAWPPSLMLGAVCIYMFNAVIYRPSEKRIESELATQCAFWSHPHVHPYEAGYADADFENVNLVPCTSDRGLYFIGGFVRDETHGFFRLDAGRQLERDDIAILYKMPSIHDITKAFGGRSFGLSILSRSHKDRTNTRRPTVPIEAVTGQLTLHDFGLGPRGIARIPPMQMTGPDVETRDEEVDPEVALDRAFSLLWAQFPSDIIQCSPNVKSRKEPAYINLSQLEREAVNHDLYRSRQLPFNAAYLRLCSEQQWRQLVFDKFFPPKGGNVSDRIQNFRHSEYFSKYTEQINNLSDADTVTIREELWNLFRGLSWLPHPASDRMWCTKALEILPRGWSVIPSGYNQTAVHIAINASKCPDLSDISLLTKGVIPPQQLQLELEDDEELAWVDLARRLATVNTATHGDPRPDLNDSAGPLLDRIRGYPGGVVGLVRPRALSFAGSSASQAGGERRDAMDRREEEESSSGVEVGRALSEEPVDVFSIGLSRGGWSPGPSRSPPLVFPSSPDLVSALLLDGQPGSPGSSHSSSASQPGRRKRRRMNSDIAEFDAYADYE